MLLGRFDLFDKQAAADLYAPVRFCCFLTLDDIRGGEMFVFTWFSRY